MVEMQFLNKNLYFMLEFVRNRIGVDKTNKQRAIETVLKRFVFYLKLCKMNIHKIRAPNAIQQLSTVY